jgi:sortase A
MSETTPDHPVREAPGGRLRGIVLSYRVESLLTSAGLTLLVFCTLSFLQSWIYQASAGFGLAVERHRARELDRSAGPGIYFEGQPLGWIEIPRLSILAVVAHGVDSGTLGRAVGHIPGTSLPGRGGNVGLAGHRDTFFRALEDIRTDDAIRLVMPERDYDYRVIAVSVVEPDRVDVLDPTSASTLTLVTCYPFVYLGSAPYRYVVRATERLDGVGIKGSLPAGLPRAR